MGFNNPHEALDGLVYELRSGEGLEEVLEEGGRGFHMGDDGVEQHESGLGVGGSLQGLFEQLLQFRPLAHPDRRHEHPHQHRNAPLDQHLRLLHIPLQEDIPKLELLFGWQPSIQLHQVALEQHGCHLSGRDLGGMGQDVGEGTDGRGHFGVGLEQFGRVLDALVVPGEGALDELEDLRCVEGLEMLARRKVHC